MHGSFIFVCFLLKHLFSEKNYLILSLMQVISRKDQAQYWCHMEVPYSYVSVDMFSRKFKESLVWTALTYYVQVYSPEAER